MDEVSRRTFLQALGAAAPSLMLLTESAVAAQPYGSGASASSSDLFSTVELSKYFNASARQFGPRELAKRLSGEEDVEQITGGDGLIRMPGGSQSFRGIPFELGRTGIDETSWIILRNDKVSGKPADVNISLNHHANFICIASFCDWDENELPPIGAGLETFEQVGSPLANVVLRYEDGEEETLPIRRRFEVNAPSIKWGHMNFNALSHLQSRARPLKTAVANAFDWGRLQTGVVDNNYPFDTKGRPEPILWVCALKTNSADKKLKGVKLVPTSSEPWVVCGITLFRGVENPLRRDRLNVYRLTLPEAIAKPSERWNVSVDLGEVCEVSEMPEFQPKEWLSNPVTALGDRAVVNETIHLYVRMTAHPNATLSLVETASGRRYDFKVAEAVSGRELNPLPTRLEVLERGKAWISGKVVDADTRQPIPARISFRSKEGRYIAPYGHREDVNDGWFQDYGGDLKLRGSCFAYVDGSFKIELPLEEVYVEVSKGFEYQPLRTKVLIEGDHRDVTLSMSRVTNLRKEGWVTADTHVHFLSPSTAVLEGQAEGVNIVNLLAAQWGALFTNVADIPQGALTSRDGETIVKIGTENRNHILGHMALVGVRGEPVYPMSTDGVEEGYIGDPMWNSLAEWSDTTRERNGLSIGAHFGFPMGEIAADIALGKIDALEIWPTARYFNDVRYLDWYRYLNCGYRLPAVVGTDKMGAYIPVGLNRTYAHLGQDEFNFDNWMKAVRQGKTFITSGPILTMEVDGRLPGSEIGMPSGSGSVDVVVDVKSFNPVHRVELLLNGIVVASSEDKQGKRAMRLSERVRVNGPSWLAARCGSMEEFNLPFGFHVLAHTSPFYIRVPGKEQFDQKTIDYMLTLIEGCKTWVNNLSTTANKDADRRMLDVLKMARENLHRRLHHHGISH